MTVLVLDDEKLLTLSEHVAELKAQERWRASQIVKNEARLKRDRIAELSEGERTVINGLIAGHREDGVWDDMAALAQAEALEHIADVVRGK